MPTPRFPWLLTVWTRMMFGTPCQAYRSRKLSAWSEPSLSGTWIRAILPLSLRNRRLRQKNRSRLRKPLRRHIPKHPTRWAIPSIWMIPSLRSPRLGTTMCSSVTRRWLIPSSVRRARRSLNACYSRTTATAASQNFSLRNWILPTRICRMC